MDKGNEKTVEVPEANPPFLYVICMTFMLLRVLRKNRHECRFQLFHLR